MLKRTSLPKFILKYKFFVQKHSKIWIKTIVRLQFENYEMSYTCIYILTVL